MKRILIFFFLFTQFITLNAQNNRSDRTPEEKKRIYQRRDKEQKFIKSKGIIQGPLLNILPERKESNIIAALKYTNSIDPEKLNFSKCNENMPEINLESEILYKDSKKKGSLHGIAQDHQDGLNTCFAQVARNMLLSVSSGKIDPSAFDIARNFKKTTDQPFNGIAGGFSCDAIKATREEGYCEKSYSPMENGEIPPFIDLITHDKNNEELLKDYYDLHNGSLEKLQSAKSSELIEKLEDVAKQPYEVLERFLGSYSKYDHPFYTVHLSYAEKSFIKHFKSQPDKYFDLIKSYPKNSASLPPFSTSFPNITWISEFADLGKYEESTLRNKRAQLEWKVRRFLTQENSLEKARELYQDFMEDVSPLIPEGAESPFTFVAFERWIKEHSNNEIFIEKNRKALKFYDQVGNIMDNKNKDLLSKCSAYQFEAFSDLLLDFESIINILKPETARRILTANKNEINPERIIEEIFLPSCKENKKALKLESRCIPISSTIMHFSNIPEEAKKSLFEKIILDNLLKNRAIGHDTQNHSNTIVGIKYDKEQQKCMLLQRDSATAQSKWVDSEILRKRFKSLNVLVD